MFFYNHIIFSVSYFVCVFCDIICPSPIRSRRIDVIFSPSLDAAQSLNNIKFLKQDEYFWLGNASDVYFSYEMLCMFARPAFHTLTSLRSWILDQVRYYSGTIVIFCSRHCHRTEKIGLMLQLPHVGLSGVSLASNLNGSNAEVQDAVACQGVRMITNI